MTNKVLSTITTIAFLSISAGTAQAANDCVIRSWDIAKNVDALRPVGVSTNFSAQETSRVFVYAMLACDVIDSPVTIKFFRAGRTVQEKEISIQPAEGYRLWSSVSALPGDYVVTLEIEGTVLNTDEFYVRP